MGETYQKKILAIALEGASKSQAVAVYDGQNLIMAKMVNIVGDPDQWFPVMLADIESKIQDGWAVLVEDRTGSLSPIVTSWNFDAITGEDGRTNLQQCLDWYFAMQSRGNIILDQSMERFAIRLGGEGSLLDTKNDEKGRLVYHVDWRKFRSEHKALLMCVAAAVMEEPLSDRWMCAMMEASKRQGVRTSAPSSRIARAILQASMHEHNEHEKAVAALEEAKKGGGYYG